MANKIKRIAELILALDMGTGKTVTTLTAIVDMLDEGRVNKVLIIAPLLVASVTWPDEFDEWQHICDIDWALLRVEDDDPRVRAFSSSARKAARLLGFDDKETSRYAGRMATRFKGWEMAKLANNNAEVHIINREALPWLWDHFRKGKDWPYDMLVVDEASMCKNGKMRTAQKKITRFAVLAKARKRTDRVVLLTGTPAPRGIENIWGLAFIADLGERLGRTKKAFQDRWFDKDYMGWNLEPKPGAVKKITSRLADIMFSLTTKDCVELPERIDNIVPVTLPDRLLREYKKFEKTLVSELYDVEAVNRGVLHGKLLQFANGSMYREEGRVSIHDRKLDALENIIDEANGTPVLVAYSYKFDLERIRKRFKHAVVFDEGDPRETKARWNEGKIQLLLAHPASVGHGQNLQYGGNISVWYGLTPDLELYQQFNKRLHRSGQRHANVVIHHIIAKGTFDEKILPILAKREATQDEVIRAVHLSIGNN